MKTGRTVRGQSFRGDQYKKGSEVFKDKLKLLPNNLEPHEVFQHFEKLFRHLETSPDDLKGKSVLQAAEILAPHFPVCAYGYPKTYMMALAGKLSLNQIRTLLSKESVCSPNTPSK